MTIWNNRQLTDREEKFREDGRCIACGVKVSAHIARDGTKMRPFECRECSDVRSRRNDASGHDFGAARASVAHAANKALGYGTRNCCRLVRTMDPAHGQEDLDRDERGRLKC